MLRRQESEILFPSFPLAQHADTRSLLSYFLTQRFSAALSSLNSHVFAGGDNAQYVNDIPWEPRTTVDIHSLDTLSLDNTTASAPTSTLNHWSTYLGADFVGPLDATSHYRSPAQQVDTPFTPPLECFGDSPWESALLTPIESSYSKDSELQGPFADMALLPDQVPHDGYSATTSTDFLTEEAYAYQDWPTLTTSTTLPKENNPFDCSDIENEEMFSLFPGFSGGTTVDSTASTSVSPLVTYAEEIVTPAEPVMTPRVKVESPLIETHAIGECRNAAMTYNGTGWVGPNGRKRKRVVDEAPEDVAPLPTDPKARKTEQNRRAQKKTRLRKEAHLEATREHVRLLENIMHANNLQVPNRDHLFCD